MDLLGDTSRFLPTFKKVWGIVQFLDVKDAGRQAIQDMFKEFLKELKQEELHLFLRFCTGKFVFLTHHLLHSFIL